MGLFDKFKKDDSKPRALDHPKDLQSGDIIKFGFVDPAGLSRHSFEVIQINTYDFQDEKSTSFTLKGDSGEILWLSVDCEDGEENLSVSRKLTRGQVLELFDESQFGLVFDEGAGQCLARRSVPKGLEGWTASDYREIEDCSKGYYHEGDYRKRQLPKFEDESKAFDYYLLEDDEEDYAIEIEVYGDGETEVMAMVYLEISSVEELWPAKTG